MNDGDCTLVLPLAPPDTKNAEVGKVRSVVVVPGVKLSHQEVVLSSSQDAGVSFEEAAAAVLPGKAQFRE